MQVTRKIQFGCNRLGNPDLLFYKEFQILQLNAKPENGFHFQEIRPQGGFQLTNPNPDFLLYCSIGKSERGFAKLFFWTVVFFLLIMHAGAKLLFLVLNPFFDIIPKKTTAKKGKLKNRYLCSIKI